MPPVSTDDNQRRFADPRASGNALTEYGLLIGFVAVVAIAGLQLLGTSIRDQLISIAGFEAKPAIEIS
jgi:Flp pilus assembly pilin Flp